ncbi:hypothetical protein SDC9_71300 [bioreactor metagenome]|uniref:DUF2235 domain-containing protein n=1 Tax=bioreactor metagenome TaxID=1076179 RepID=A0A644YFC6_9ZZZZ
MGLSICLDGSRNKGNDSDEIEWFMGLNTNDLGNNFKNFRKLSRPRFCVAEMWHFWSGTGAIGKNPGQWQKKSEK